MRSLVPGLDLQTNVVARAARSPIEVGLDRLGLDEDIDYEPGSGSGSGGDRVSDVDFQMRLDYASSTIYYSVLGVFTGGGYAEQVGDVRATRSGHTITMADRARFKAMGDELRKKWGWPISEEGTASSEMFDASSVR